MEGQGETERRYLSMTEAGAAVGLCAARISQLALAGEIPSRRWGRRVLIERAGLEAWRELRRELLGR